MSNSVPTLQQFVERARNLYSLPAVAVKVLELTNHPQVDIRALKECIENDPAITTKVLRVVNSSLFGLSREVSDLNQALALLGIKPLKLLVLGFSLSEAVFAKFTGKIMLRYWRHTLTKAVAAREIAEMVCRIPGDEAFIAALLQDIGMLVLLQELGEPYARLLSRPFATQHDLIEWEMESLGFDHTELTERLLVNWGMPESLQMAVAASHGEPSRAVQPVPQALSRILHLANLLADLLVDERHDLLANLLDSVTPHGRLTGEQLGQLVSNLQEKVAQLSDVFSLSLPPGLDYRDVLIQAHVRMSDVAAELTSELVHTNRPRVQPVCEAAVMLDDVQALSAAVTQFIKSPLAKPPAEEKRVRFEPPALTSAADSPSRANGVGPQTATATVAAAETEAGLLNRLSLMVYACRQSRWSLSLALVEIDQFPHLVLKNGPQKAARLARLVQDACRGIDVAQASCVPTRQYAFALALPNCDRHQAAKLCDQLMQDVRRMAHENPQGSSGLTISIGLASVDAPPKNFSANALHESAARCLSAAQLSGGNTLKSIGIY